MIPMYSVSVMCVKVCCYVDAEMQTSDDTDGMTVAACGTGLEFLCLMACSRQPEPTETREQVLEC